MKIILVVCVIFVKYLQFNNAGGELLSQDMLGTLSECQGKNCLSLDTSLNSRSLDPVDKSFTLEKFTNRQLRHAKHSKTEEEKKNYRHAGKKMGKKRKFAAKLKLSKVEKKIHHAAARRIRKTKKLGKSHQKSIKRLLEKYNFNVSSLLKMSRAPSTMLVVHLKIAKNMSISSTEEILVFVNSSVAKLRDSIEHAGQDIKELAESYWNQMVSSAKEDFKTIGDGTSPEAKKQKFEETSKFLNKVAQCSCERLMDVYRTWESELTAQAAVIELYSKDCNKYIMDIKEKELQKYIKFACEKMKQLTQNSSNKLHEISKSCLQFLLEVAENSIKSIKELTEYLIQIANAIVDNDKDKVSKTEKGIIDLYDKMDHSNKQLYDNMMINITGIAGALIQFNENIVHSFES